MKDLLSKLGGRIKEKRKTRGMTQELLAERAGITPRYLSRLELGQQSPSIETLAKLTAVLEIELSEVFEVSHLGTVKELRGKLQKMLNELDEHELRVALKLLKAVIR